MSDLIHGGMAGSGGDVSELASLRCHLETWRLQAELSALESRIQTLTASSAERSAGTSGPFAQRAEDLADEVVESLLQVGRAEISTESDRRRAEAQGLLDSAAARAEAIVEAARRDLAAALLDRGERVDAARLLHQDLDALLRGEPVAALVSGPSVPPQFDPRHLLSAASTHPGADGDAVGFDEPLVVDDALVRTGTGPGAAEEARTDAAFEAWMAVGPSVGLVGDVPGTNGKRPEPVRPSTATSHRSAWLLPLEVVGALLAAAIIVVLVLVVIG